MAELGGLFYGLGQGLAQGGQSIGQAIQLRGLLEQRQQQLDRIQQNTLFDQAYKTTFGTPGLDDETRRVYFNKTIVPLFRRQGVDAPELESGQFNTRTAEKFVKQAHAIFRQFPDPNSEEREDLLEAVLANMLTDPSTAPVGKLIVERTAAQRQAFVSQMTDLYEKAMRGTATEEELRTIATEEAVANTPGLAQGSGRSQARLTNSLIEAKRAGVARIAEGIKQRKEGILTVPTASRAVELTPAGGMREVVAAAPSDKEVLPARAAAQTFAGLLATNPGMSEEAAAIQAWRQHGDLPDSMKSLVPPLVKAELEAEIKKQAALEPGRIRIAQQTGAAAVAAKAEVERDQPLGPERASKLFHPTTREQASPDISQTEAQRRGFRAIPEDQIRGINILEANIVDAEDVIRRRDDLFPRSTGNKITDAANIAAAKAIEIAGRASGDADVQTLDSLRGMMMHIQRAFGGTSRQMDSVIELLRTERAFHITPGGYDAVREQVRVLRDRLDEGFKSVGLAPMKRPKAAGPAGDVRGLSDAEIMKRLRGSP